LGEDYKIRSGGVGWDKPYVMHSENETKDVAELCQGPGRPAFKK
jgi:hypothetical protein